MFRSKYFSNVTDLFFIRLQSKGWMEMRVYLYIAIVYIYIYTKLNSVALVRERTIPTERPPPVGEVSANFCG